MPIDAKEARELLGYPEEEQPDEIEEPPEEPGTVEGMVAQAAANYRAGTITADELAQYALAEMAEVISERWQ